MRLSGSRNTATEPPAGRPRTLIERLSAVRQTIANDVPVAARASSAVERSVASGPTRQASISAAPSPKLRGALISAPQTISDSRSAASHASRAESRARALAVVARRFSRSATVFRRSASAHRPPAIARAPEARTIRSTSRSRGRIGTAVASAARAGQGSAKVKPTPMAQGGTAHELLMSTHPAPGCIALGTIPAGPEAAVCGESLVNQYDTWRGLDRKGMWLKKCKFQSLDRLTTGRGEPKFSR